MATVLVVPPALAVVIGEAWEMEGRDAPYVDFIADDLAAFLDDILTASGTNQ